MRKILVMAIIVIIIIFCLGIVKDQIIRLTTTVLLSKITGAPVHIANLSFGITNSRVEIKGFKMYNPPGFNRGILVDIPKIYVVYELGAILQGKMHFKEAEFILKELALVKNEKGQLNVDSLSISKPKKEEVRLAKQPDLRINKLRLEIGRLIHEDYVANKEERVKVYDINIRKEYKNITSFQQLILLVLTEPMKEAGIKGASIYGLSALAGVAILPVAVGATLVGRDSAEATFNKDPNAIFDIASDILKASGKITNSDRKRGTIKAEVDSAVIAVSILARPARSAHVRVSARKFLFPRPEIASGIIYQISEKLK